VVAVTAAASAPALVKVFGEPGDLSADDFARVAKLLHAATGIHLPKGKESLVRARLAARVRALSLQSYGAYVDLLARDPSGAEMDLAIDLLSTNKTAFFREARHFELLGEEMRRAIPRKLRIWSAACSTGEEPYSIAMTLTAAGAILPYCDTRVLATDICRHALATAQQATYAPAGLTDVPAEYARRYFEPGDKPGTVTVTSTVRALVGFARLNLMEPWPMKGPFDIIFCRNVMIYFDHATQERLVERMRGLLAPGGLLLIGHAESLSALRHQYSYVAPATYRK
jgi:chemotaxis protein methyltransferase CheR